MAAAILQEQHGGCNMADATVQPQHYGSHMTCATQLAHHYGCNRWAFFFILNLHSFYRCGDVGAGGGVPVAGGGEIATNR